jgi:hypothetical protein
LIKFKVKFDLRENYSKKIFFILIQAILPPWPFWNKNPLKWQKPAVKQENSKTNIPSETKKSLENKKK